MLPTMTGMQEHKMPTASSADAHVASGAFAPTVVVRASIGMKDGGNAILTGDVAAYKSLV